MRTLGASGGVRPPTDRHVEHTLVAVAVFGVPGREAETEEPRSLSARELSEFGRYSGSRRVGRSVPEKVRSSENSVALPRQYLGVGRESERTDDDLLSAVAEDPQAFLEIYERHFSPVYRFIIRQLGPATAEDAVAEVFVRALRSAHTFAQGSADARPWLLGIASNVVRAELRQRYAAHPHPLDAMDPAAARAVDESELDAVGRLAEVQRALELVPIDDREPLLLFAWLDLPYEEIAIALGLPIGTVRSRIARARRHLRKELGMERSEAASEAAHDR